MSLQKRIRNRQEQSRSRRARVDGAEIAEDPDAQVRFAEAEAALDAVRLQLHRNFAELMAQARAGTLAPLEQRARYRFDATRAIDAAWQAGNMVMAASGGTAIFLDNPLQRAVRDLMAIRVHPAGNLGKSELRASGFWAREPRPLPVVHEGRSRQGQEIEQRRR